MSGRTSRTRAHPFCIVCEGYAGVVTCREAFSRGRAFRKGKIWNGNGVLL